MAYFRQRGKTWSFTLEGDGTSKRNQIVRSGFKDEAAARTACEKLEEEIRRGKRTKIQTVESFATTYFEKVVKGQVEDSTYINQWIWLKNHIFPKLGKMKIDRIGIDDIQDFYSDLQTEGVKKGTIKNVGMVLKKVFKEAEGKRVITFNPAKFVKIPAYKPPIMNVWSLAVVKKFTEIAVDVEYYPIYILGLYSGMRIGEMLALEITDLDLPNRDVYISKTIKHSKERGLYVKKPKTDNSARRVKLPKFVADILEEYISKIPKGVHIVFHNYGGYHYPSEIYRRFKADCIDLSMPPIRIHDLRHTHVTMLFSLPRDQRPNAKTVADRIGDTVQTVMTTYAHVLKDMQDEIADTLDFIQ